MKNAISVKYTLLCGTACCMASAVQAQHNVSDVSRMNVLFLMADDMRPELGCYGVEAVKTPNMDRLASSGVLFQNAYCNVPVSGASRASLHIYDKLLISSIMTSNMLCKVQDL